MATIADLLSACLRAQGATRTFGDRSVPGLAHVPVADPELARLLADADGRIGAGAGAALSGRSLRVSSRPGATVDEVVVDAVADLPTVLAQWQLGGVFGCLDLQLSLDLEAPVPSGLEPLVIDRPPGAPARLAPDLADLGVLVLVGPGVVRAGQVASLGAMASRGGFGVVNTWGAKGVFAWDSPHHFGTAGLQARDFDLAGFGEAGLVIASGVDVDEAPPERWAGAQVLEVDPRDLEALTFGWTEAAEVPPVPPLYRELREALGPLYASTAVPISPARAAAGLAAVRPTGGLVAADPGPVGLWVARTFPTTEPGSVVVPARAVAGFATAAALVAGLDGRPAIAVTAGPLDEVSARVLDLARSLEVPVAVEVWGDEGDAADADAQLDRTRVALASGGVVVEHYPVDLDATRVLVDVAGPVVAWGGL